LGENLSFYKSSSCSWSAYHFILLLFLSDGPVMFTPALTAFGAQVTHAPSPSLSMSAAAGQTTLIQAVRRDDPPNILTNDQTCGYTSGVWSSAVTCGPQASCTYYTGPAAPNFGCCTDGQGCDYVSTCMDYGAKGNINTGGGVGLGNQEFMW
jgi:hypothetical protein